MDRHLMDFQCNGSVSVSVGRSIRDVCDRSQKRGIDPHEHSGGHRTTANTTKAAKLFINESPHIIPGQK